MNNHLSLQLIGTFKNTMTYDIRNPGPGLGEAQTYGRVKLLNGNNYHTIWIMNHYLYEYVVVTNSGLYPKVERAPSIY
jgi:hypothetical protein